MTANNRGKKEVDLTIKKCHTLKMQKLRHSLLVELKSNSVGKKLSLYVALSEQCVTVINPEFPIFQCSIQELQRKKKLRFGETLAKRYSMFNMR